MINKIKNSFILCSVNSCHSLLKASFYVYDCNVSNRSVVQNTPFHFEVLNPSNKDIHFVAIDNCTIPSNYFRKCDFAVFDDNTFCFVEIKNVDLGQRYNARQKAKEQLGETIKLFKERIDMNHLKIEAIICLKAAKIFPAFPSRSQSASIEFADNFGALLLEGNSREFS